ncbi:hypothetical protein BDN67DRAFT_1017247 [Paxillus ammoniavirescens]|nr:hypothetical protein BDN67DRAFT_1017247 [Paxillus ammoniavirescens]
MDDEGWDGGVDDELVVGLLDGRAIKGIHLPLPSVLGLPRCRDDGLEWLAKQEIQLRTGQANDALHKLRLTLADKAVLFHTDVRHSSSQATTSRAWVRVTAVDATVNKFAKIYRVSQRAMVALSVSNDILAWYQALTKDHLKVSSAVAKPNARGHRNDTLPWSWSMDVARDAEADDWMMEFYRVHWLQSKALRDRWEEEVELIRSEANWTRNFFKFKARFWANKEEHSGDASANRVQACYAARQSIIYGRLRDHCREAFKEE